MVHNLMRGKPSMQMQKSRCKLNGWGLNFNSNNNWYPTDEIAVPYKPPYYDDAYGTYISSMIGTSTIIEVVEFYSSTNGLMIGKARKGIWADCLRWYLKKQDVMFSEKEVKIFQEMR